MYAIPLLLLWGCTEPFNAPVEDFEDILVIDAFITGELKTQEIFISRTFLSGEDVRFESNASVQVTDDAGNVFLFQEDEPGRYISQFEFSAQQDRLYSLSIVTENGSSFSSGPTGMTGISVLENLEVAISTSEDGQQGLSIFADGEGVGSGASFFRYDYEETIQIVSPFGSDLDLVITSVDPPLLEVVSKTVQDRVCYRTQNSQEIIIASSENLSSNRIEDFEVNFIPSDDFALRSRYSILVNQYVQSAAAQSFYEDLREFSNITTLFAQTQPGFVQGNIDLDSPTGERVLGLFEVASVSSQRIFINREDFFSDTRPSFLIGCTDLEFGPTDPLLFQLIQQGSHKFFAFGTGTFFIVETGCVDCTTFGSNVRPDFWED